MFLKQRSKYGNKKVVIDGEKFDSLREYRRYNQLLLLVKSKQITELERQVVFVLQEKFKDFRGNLHRPITYIADFVYRDKKYNGNLVVEDSKGMRTDVFKIKKKLLIKKYPHVIFVET